MDIEILDSWKEFGTNFAVIKTSEGVFVISRGRTSYAIEGEAERFILRPCRIYKKPVCITWSVETNPADVSKSSERFRDDLSKIKDLTGVDPFILMEIVKKEEEN